MMDETVGRTHFRSKPIHGYERYKSRYVEPDRRAPPQDMNSGSKARSNTGIRRPTSREPAYAVSSQPVAREQRPLPDPIGSTASAHTRAPIQYKQQTGPQYAPKPEAQLSALDKPPPSPTDSEYLSGSSSTSVGNGSRSGKKTQQPQQQDEQCKAPLTLHQTMSSRPKRDHSRGRTQPSRVGTSRVNRTPPEEHAETAPRAKRFKERFIDIFKSTPNDNNNNKGNNEDCMPCEDGKVELW